jgi:hypothetical protein
VLLGSVLRLKKYGSLLDALAEEIEVHHVLLDFNDWQIDKHTGYFRGVCANQL